MHRPLLSRLIYFSLFPPFFTNRKLVVYPLICTGGTQCCLHCLVNFVILCYDLTLSILQVCFPQQDSRFNQEIDKKTGYHTRSILCMPILDHYHGEVQYNTCKIWGKMNPGFYRGDFGEQFQVALSGLKECFCGTLILTLLLKDKSKVL